MIPIPRGRWFVGLVWLFRVGQGGSMTDFAGDVEMIPCSLYRDDVIVTFVADLVASVGNVKGGDFFQGRCAVVTVLAESLGNKAVPHWYEYHDDNRQQYHEAFALFGNSRPCGS
jgi:hypothetical protein